MNFHRVGCPPQVEAGLERHALPRIAPMVHALLSPGLGQGFIGHPSPHLPDDLNGVQGALVALVGDTIQGADLLSQTPIRLHFARRQEHVEVVVPGLPVDPDVHPDMEGICQPVREPFRQGGFLVAAEPTRQSRVKLTCRHGLPSPVVGFHGIPERGSVRRGTAAGQNQGKRGNVLLAGVVRHKPRSEVHHPGPGPVGTGRDRRPPLGPPQDRHGQVVEGWAGGLHGGLLGAQGAGLLWGVGGVP